MKRLVSLTLALLLALMPVVSLAESDEAFQSMWIFVQSALNTRPALQYSVQPEYSCFTFFHETENQTLGNIYSYLEVHEDGILVRAYYYNDIPGKRLDEVTKLINLINCKQHKGKFYIYANEIGTVYFEIFLQKSLLDLAADPSDAFEVLFEAHDAVLAEMLGDIPFFAAVVQGSSSSSVISRYPD